MNNSILQNKICLIGTNEILSNNLIDKGFTVSQYGRNTFPKLDFYSDNLANQYKHIIDNETSKKFIIASGFLQQKGFLDQTKDEITKSFFINSVGPLLFSEYLFKRNSEARLIIIGSESGYKGSFDLSYALSKSSLKLYVEQKRLEENQQILLISPSTISDLGMTTRREDKENLEKYKEKHPKKRFLSSKELTDLIINLFASTNYLTNIEIGLNGGKFCLMD